jgi:hypothetical protein
MTHKIQVDGQIREMTQDEQTAFDAWRSLEADRAKAANDAAKIAADARASALAKLADLGLSKAEIAALVG